MIYSNVTAKESFDKLIACLAAAQWQEELNGYYGATGFSDGPEAHDWFDTLLSFGPEATAWFLEMEGNVANGYEMRYADRGLEFLANQAMKPQELHFVEAVHALDGVRSFAPSFPAQYKPIASDAIEKQWHAVREAWIRLQQTLPPIQWKPKTIQAGWFATRHDPTRRIADELNVEIKVALCALSSDWNQTTQNDIAAVRLGTEDLREVEKHLIHFSKHQRTSVRCETLELLRHLGLSAYAPLLDAALASRFAEERSFAARLVERYEQKNQ
jgi:hypothetical protein